MCWNLLLSPLIVETKAERANFELQTVKTANRIVVDFLDSIVLAPYRATRARPYDLDEVSVMGVLCAVSIRVIVANND